MTTHDLAKLMLPFPPYVHRLSSWSVNFPVMPFLEPYVFV
jgi:hypothetical protein